MKIIQLELILTHSPRKIAPPQDELSSIFYFKNVSIIYAPIFAKITDDELCGLVEFTRNVPTVIS